MAAKSWAEVIAGHFTGMDVKMDWIQRSQGVAREPRPLFSEEDGFWKGAGRSLVLEVRRK